MNTPLSPKLALLLVPILLLASSAGAGSPGTWTRVSDPNGTNSDEVALARTADGVLHAVWRRHGNGVQELRHTAISRSGRVGKITDVVRSWSSVGNPYLLRDASGGLRVLFGGIQSNAVREPITVNTATAPPSGASWALQPGSAGGSRLQVTDVGGALARDGVPVSVWPDTAPGSNGWHFGTNGAEPGGTYETRCCVLAPDAAVDARSGDVVLVWFSTVQGRRGIFAQPIGRTAPAGAKRLAPGSVTRGNAVVPTHRLGVSARVGAPGVYVAYGSGYPSYGRVVLWRYGAARPTISIAAGGAEHVNVGSAPGGRLWLMWERGGTLYFTRTNRAATRAGRVVSARPPAGTTRIWRLKGDGVQAQPLDALVHVTSRGGTASWHTQVLPGLQLDARVAGGKTSVLVHEAGDPVAGAVVLAGGRRAVTDARGRVSLGLGSGAHVVRASKPGYQPIELRVRIP